MIVPFDSAMASAIGMYGGCLVSQLTSAQVRFKSNAMAIFGPEVQVTAAATLLLKQVLLGCS
jgi:hypothetical protein